MKHFTIITQGQSASVGCPLGSVFSLIRKYVLVMGFLFLSGLAIGQGYLPLPTSDAVWSVSAEKITMMGDTVINEITYSKVYFHYGLTSLNTDALIYRCALRQDLEGGKVWAVWRNSQQEMLLYDFSAEAGQQLTVTNDGYPYGIPNSLMSFTVEIEAVDTIELGGVQRRRIQLVGNYSGLEYWIEGIGSTFGVIYSGTSYWQVADMEIPELVCYDESGQSIIHLDEDCYFISGVGIKEPSKEYADVKAIPSIVKDHFLIESSIPFNQFAIYNSSGQMIMNEKGAKQFDSFTVDAGSWEPGIYFVNIQAKNWSKTVRVVRY